MNLKYYLRGLGLGIVMTAIIVGIAARGKDKSLTEEEIVEKAKSAKLTTINEIIDTVFPEISTSFTSGEILKLSAGLLKYSIGETEGFPQNTALPESIPGYSGSYVVPVGLEQNVRRAHEFLFPEKEYKPTDTLTEISNEICDLTDVYPETAEE